MWHLGFVQNLDLGQIDGKGWAQWRQPIAPGLLPFWYFHLPNYVLAALMYTLIGRFILGMIAPAVAG